VLVSQLKARHRTGAEVEAKARAPILLPLDAEHLDGRSCRTSKEPEGRSVSFIQREAALLHVRDEATLDLVAKCGGGAQ
jgi:hypothetical protein